MGHRSLVFLVVILLGCAATDPPLASRVHLEGTPISVSNPAGFSIDPHVHDVDPALFFRLRPRRNQANHPVYPELSIRREPILSAEEFVARQEREGKPVLLGPRRRRVAEVPALEIATLSAALRDPWTGAPRRAVRHTLAFEHGGRTFICSLTTNPGTYEEYVSSFDRFCGSIRLDRSP